GAQFSVLGGAGRGWLAGSRPCRGSPRALGRAWLPAALQFRRLAGMLAANILVTNIPEVRVRAGRWWMLAVTCLSVLVVALDLTILNIALPAISADLHAGTGDLQWIVDAYSLTFAGVMLPAGLAGDRFGRRRLLMAGLAVFLGASVWCALSVSAGGPIAARAGMGVGGPVACPPRPAAP